ncbi:MAG: hypothetical protein ACXVKA_13405 [Acidimicrobiia bacterium]
MDMPKWAGKTAAVVGAWVISVALAVIPWLVLRYSPLKLQKWATIYVAGALGGLVLELLLSRGRVELPSVSGTTKEDETDERRPLGPQIDLGFLARVTSSGLAAVAFLLVYNAMVQESDALKETEPATFGWAVFIGASSPAIWAAAKQLVQARVGALTAKNDELMKNYKAVQGALQTAASQGAEHVAPAAVPVAAALSKVEDQVRPVLTEAAEAQPANVDVDRLLNQVVTGLQADLEEAAPAGAVVAPQLMAAVNQALGIVNSQLSEAPVPTER